ncbi:MAG: glycerol-3-phosphate dehydrogenase, partial [Nitratireductor sp.]
MPNNQNSIYDIFIIGGGINGAGIARDAAGRGYSVALAEMNDFGSATSSSSTKLFHGGLRYLEYLEFRLVKEALTERETLLKAMPHISWPMRFVLPFHKDMRFESNTPVSRLLSIIMPWAKGARPAWLIRTALFLYDHLGGRKILPGTKTINLKKDITGDAIDDRFLKAFEYSDCWVEDARLVILNAIDAKEKGATILARTKVESAKQVDGIWQIKSKDKNGKTKTHKAKMIVNAGGPWVGDLIHSKMHLKTNEGIRLVRGSHIITKRLFEHDKTYFFQGTDGRIIFAIPYEEDFTLIGTTDAEHDALSTKPECTPEEANYLVNFANNYFKKDISTKDIVWTYSGVRPLYDEGVEN